MRKRTGAYRAYRGLRDRHCSEDLMVYGRIILKWYSTDIG
jgi:hypothetical protein